MWVNSGPRSTGGDVSQEVNGGEVNPEVKGEASSEVKEGEVSPEVKGTPFGSRVKGGETTKMRAVVRLRPFTQRERDFSSTNIIEIAGNKVTLKHPEKEDNYHQFEFDSCHWSHDGFIVNEDGAAIPDGPDSRFSGQEVVFQDVGLKSMELAWRGYGMPWRPCYNTTMIYYGMTGAGKSYTMLGNSSDPGLVYRCCRHLFSEMDSNPQNEYKVTLSLLEVHNEMVVDLLSKSAGKLNIRQHRGHGVRVEGLSVMMVKSAAQTEEVILQGMMNRSVAATRMNRTSSRSHLVITIRFIQFITEDNGTHIKRGSQIRFVDTAGSERLKKTGASGDTLREAKMINISVSGLRSVLT
ncbi:hypothetical protein ACOMHN_003970 [Nucella lapillus]